MSAPNNIAAIHCKNLKQKRKEKKRKEKKRKEKKRKELTHTKKCNELSHPSQNTKSDFTDDITAVSRCTK